MAGYRGGGTIGGKWGCALSTLVALPLLGGLFVVSALGDCADGVACHRGPSLRLILIALLIAVGIGFGTRLLVNVTFRRVRAAAQAAEDQVSPTEAP